MRNMAKETKKEKKDQFDEEFNRWIVQIEAEIERTRRSERLTQKDFAIRINTQN